MSEHSVFPDPVQPDSSASNRLSLLDEFASFLKARGHHEGSTLAYLNSVAHYTHWLTDQYSDQNTVSPETVCTFLQIHLPDCHCLPPAPTSLKTVRAALHQLLLMKGESRLIKQAHRTHEDLEASITQFDLYMLRVCGLSPSTRRYRCRFVRDFLETLFGHQSSLQCERITADALVRYVTDKAPDFQPASTGVMVCSLRSYLRFLQFNGQLVPHLNDYLHRPANWPMSTLPDSLSEADLVKFWNAFNCSSAIGKRDYAMARCLMDMALRCHEVADLCLDDIDWRAGIVRLFKTKNRHHDGLPLPPSVGQALTDYLRFGRPVCMSRAVFVYHCAPRGLGLVKTTVRGAIRRAFNRAGLPWTGTHILRHTAATHLLKAGNSIKDIADVLRHRSIDTTLLYTKVDLPHLERVALPWPGDRL